MSNSVSDRRTPRAYPDLAGKVAVVTGGSRGIGAATARAFGTHGVVVAVVGRDQPAIAATVESVTSQGGAAIGFSADCTDEEAVESLRRDVDERVGPADIVSPFAGGNGMPVATDAETAAHWREVIESDLTSTFL